VNTFQTRGGDYNRAGAACPDARAIERQLLIDRLRLRGDEIICDAPAGGGYLADGIAETPGSHGRIICVEPSAAFAAGINPRHETHIAPLERLPLTDASIDRAGSLAGLHHLEAPQRFFHETHRVLRSSGVFAVADVREGSPPAVFLNDAVHRLTETGHDGRFFREGRFAEMLATCGFVDIEERCETCPWRFPDVDTMTRYCRTLFGMYNADEAAVRREIDAALDVRETDGGVELQWSLLYASGVKPG